MIYLKLSQIYPPLWQSNTLLYIKTTFFFIHSSMEGIWTLSKISVMNCVATARAQLLLTTAPLSSQEWLYPFHFTKECTQRFTVPWCRKLLTFIWPSRHYPKYLQHLYVSIFISHCQDHDTLIEKMCLEQEVLFVTNCLWYIWESYFSGYSLDLNKCSAYPLIKISISTNT